MKSIMQGQKRCLICRSPDVEKHHVFGAANRQNSEKYGLTVWLCHKHHNEPPEGVHFNRRFMDELHEWGQRQFETYYPTKNFTEIFGKNYVMDVDED